MQPEHAPTDALCALRPFLSGGAQIVFDLEWNQSYRPNPRMPHEIIEIGACRLDAQGRVSARFSEIVRPQLYRRLDRHIRQVTGITEEELSGGRPFEAVIEDFIAFCGPDPQLITWGRDDYPVLRRNLQFYRRTPFSAPPLDAQLVFGFAHFGDAHRQMNLHAALEETGTALEVPAHRAVYDALATAALLPAVSSALSSLEAQRLGELSPLLERERRIADAQLRARPTGYFQNSDALCDDALTVLACPICQRMTRLDPAWFDDGRGRYLAIGTCEVHGLIEGQMHLRRQGAGPLTWQQRAFLSREKDAQAVREAYRLFTLIPEAKRHHRLSMHSAREKAARRERR